QSDIVERRVLHSHRAERIPETHMIFDRSAGLDSVGERTENFLDVRAAGIHSTTLFVGHVGRIAYGAQPSVIGKLRQTLRTPFSLLTWAGQCQNKTNLEDILL